MMFSQRESCQNLAFSHKKNCYFSVIVDVCQMYPAESSHLIFEVMRFQFTWLVSLYCGSSLEIFLNWLRFPVNFFIALFCLLTPSMIISRAITSLFLSVPNSLCSAINLVSFFYPNARDDSHLNKTRT